MLPLFTLLTVLLMLSDIRNTHGSIMSSSQFQGQDTNPSSYIASLKFSRALQLGKPCELNSNSMIQFSASENSNLTESESSMKQCPENSSCKYPKRLLWTLRPECVCNKNYLENESRNECVLAVKHGESCDETEMENKCSPAAELSCSKSLKKCKCRFEEQTFDEKFQTCRTPLDGRCFYNSQCTLNSMCRKALKTYNFGGTSILLSRKESKYGQCICKEGYLKRNYSCTLGFNQDCSSSSNSEESDLADNYSSKRLISGAIDPPCHNNFKCIDGKCKCPRSIHQIYDSGIKQCLNLVDSPCKHNYQNNSTELCVENAVCVPQNENEEKNGKCECKVGYSATPAGQCMLGHRAKCSGRGDCNYFKGLACIDGFCECFDSSLIKLPGLPHCMAPVGSPCGKVESIGDSTAWEWAKQYYVKCVAGANCELDSSADTLAYKCEPKWK